MQIAEVRAMQSPETLRLRCEIAYLERHAVDLYILLYVFILKFYNIFFIMYICSYMYKNETLINYLSVCLSAVAFIYAAAWRLHSVLDSAL